MFTLFQFDLVPEHVLEKSREYLATVSRESCQSVWNGVGRDIAFCAAMATPETRKTLTRFWVSKIDMLVFGSANASDPLAWADAGEAFALLA